MIGTITLRGIQIKNIFIDETGREFKIANSWVPPIMQVEKYVLLRKRDDDYWQLIRDIRIRVIEL
jgi:spore maturation protein SpmB